MEIGTTYQMTLVTGEFVVGTLLAFDALPSTVGAEGPTNSMVGRFNVKSNHAETVTNIVLDHIVRYTAEIEV